MTNKKLSLNEVRLLTYRRNSELCPYLDEWKKSPYTFFKSRLYTELSAILIYLLLKTRIRPNTVTITYGLLGLLGGVLLAIPVRAAIITAICIFFFKSVLDWSDGYYARLSEQTTITGAILDPYGGHLGALGFQMGLGFYVAQKSGIVVFYYLTALIPFFYAANLYTFGSYAIYLNFLKPDILKEYLKKDSYGRAATAEKDNPEVVKYSKYKKIYNFMEILLDMRARVMDFVCLLLLIEIFTPLFITWLAFIGFVLQRFFIFCGFFYWVARGGWAEKKLEEKAEELFN